MAEESHVLSKATVAVRLVLVLAVGVCMPLFAASPAMAKGVRVIGPRIISGDTPLAENCDGLGQETETTVAVDPREPRHLVAAWMQDRDKSNVVATSRDGGKTWKLSTVPGISQCTGGSAQQVVDPWVSIGSRGVAYLSSQPLSGFGFLVNRSLDGGSSWSAPANPDPSGVADDLPSLVADPRGAGRLYFTWSSFTLSGGAISGGQGSFSRSVDGAETFSMPVAIRRSPAGQLVAESRLVVLSDGSLLDIFGEGPITPLTAPQETFASRSVNGGRTWSHPVRITAVPQDAILDPDTGTPQFAFCCIFGVAAGRHGTAYLAYTEVAARDSARVVVVRSNDGGRSWGLPRIVARVRAQAFQAAVAVAGDGTVAVTWYDFRNDKAGDAALTTDVWFAYSHNQGKEWHQTHLGGPFDLRTARRTGRPVGDYQGLAGLPHGFAATFIQAQPQAKNGAEDVFFARVNTPGKAQGRVRPPR